jgi:integrase
MEDVFLAEKKRKLEAAVGGLKKSTLSPKNIALILDFQGQKCRENLSIHRGPKYIQHMSQIARWAGKDLDTFTLEDVQRVVDAIASGGFTDNTMYDYLSVFSMFGKWLRKTEKNPWGMHIKKPSKGKRRSLPKTEEIYTQEEIKKLISDAGSIRNSAMFAVLYETAARPGSELLKLRIKDIEFDKFGARIRIDGKKTETSKRFVRIVISVPFLSKWLSIHPLRKNGDSYLWISENRNNGGNVPIRYRQLDKLFRETVKKCGINRNPNLYCMRKTRITHWYDAGVDAHHIAYMAGHKLNSPEILTYANVSAKGPDESILKMHGLKSDEIDVKNNGLQPIVCPICGEFNENGTEFCRKCARPLGVKAALEAEKEEQTLKRQLEELKSFKEKIDKMIDEALERKIGERGLVRNSR